VNNVQKRINLTFVSLLLGSVLTLVACATPQAPAAPAATATNAEQPADAATTAEQPAATAAKLNLNTVTEEALLNTIPDFGNRMVREFFEYRPYISIQQFRREIGKYVDEAQVATYEQYVYVPVNVNEADAATIMQIPGVDEATAEGLVAARPYESPAAFLDKLTELAPAVDRTAAESYLEAQ
jgi:DNA uptake protein ComE-like DNA-binding protein